MAWNVYQDIKEMMVESTELEENIQVSGQQMDEEAARERHRQRIEQMRRDKEKQMMRRRTIKKYAPLGGGLLVVLLLIFGGAKLLHGNLSGKAEENREQEERILKAEVQEQKEPEVKEQETVLKEESSEAAGFKVVSLKEEEPPKSYQADATSDTLQVGDTLQSGDPFYSEYAILIDLESNQILAEKYAKTRINPASMTKILTVLVAAEQIQDLEDTFIVTRDLTDYCYINDCSYAGFEKEEKVTIRDLFYGAVLPSGADAALGLATYVSGSQEAFVELMNEKLEELGLSGSTHFTNCVGIYDENHYSTVYDMAMIMEAAMDNELCREVMSAHTYTTSETKEHPEGIILSNWFLRRIEDRDSGGEVICGKTGYVVQSGNCAASYAADDTGREYICVTAKANSGNRCIADQAGLYKQFAKT